MSFFKMLNPVKRRVPWQLRLIIKAILDHDARFLVASFLPFGGDIHQPTGYTVLNRYPKTFMLVKSLIHKRKGIRILSFGCSTGEEVTTLRQYFPCARIIGAERNKQRLKKCRKLPLDDEILFVSSASSDIDPHAPFDVIFAMAVLQKLPMQNKDTRNIRGLYPFEKFERQLLELDGYLKPGGLLVVQNTQYRLADSSISNKYECVGKTHERGNGPAIYDRFGVLIKETYYADVVFRKLIT